MLIEMKGHHGGAELSQRHVRFQHRRRIAVAIVIGLILIALLTIRSAWSNDRVHEYIEDFGIGVIVMTILGRMWCTLYIGGRKSSEIVRLGPIR